MKKFPLAPLLHLRARAVEACRETLHEADIQLTSALQAQARAEQAERAHDATRRAVEEQEAEMLAAGELRAQDLSRMLEFELGARAVATRLHEQNRLQGQKVQRAERDHATALQSLAEARAESRVIEGRHEQFVRAEHTALEANAEEEALETWHVRKVEC